MKKLPGLLVAALPRLSAVVNRFCWRTASAFMLLMLLVVGLQVVSRYLFFSPPSWTEELARYCMIWAGYLGATVAFYRREDPVLVTRKKAGESALAGFNFVLRNVAVVVFMLPVLYWSPVIIGHHMLRRTESMQLISGYVMLIVPVFSAVILIHVLARVVEAVSGQNMQKASADQ